MSTEPSYFNAYENFSLTRTAAGVLTVRLNTNGGPITFTGAAHSQFPRVLEDIAFDRDNQVMVLTGTGDSFMAPQASTANTPSSPTLSSPAIPPSSATSRIPRSGSCPATACTSPGKRCSA